MANDKRFIAKNGLDNNSKTITNVTNPLNAQDAATKSYVDTQVATAGTFNSWTISDGTFSEAISDSDTLTVTGTGASTVSYNVATNTLTINSTDTNTTYGAASATVLGLVKLEDATVQSVAANAVSATASRTYGIQVNSSGQLVVNVPWVDTNTNTTYSAGSGITLTGTTFSNAAPDQVVSLTGSGATSVTGTYPNFTISSTDTDTVYTLPAATSTVLGGIELFSDTVQSVAATAVSATASRTYGIQLNAAGQAVVNVPWVDTNTTYTAGTGLTLSGTTFSNTAPDQVVSLTGSGATSVTGTYPNFTISSTDTNTVYTLPEATSTVRGGIELFSDTDQAVAANAVSATAGRTYGIQLNSAGQAVVNVPWTNTETESFRTQAVTDTDTGYTWAATGSAVADSPTDTLTWVSGSGINIDVDAALDAIRITNTAPDQTVTLTGSGATSVSGTYPNFTISSTDTNTVYTLPAATSTVRGGIELFSDTVQSVAANAVSATASRTYGVQVNSAGQAVVNVPWVDTNTNTTYTAGTGLSLTGTTFSVDSTIAPKTYVDTAISNLVNGADAAYDTLLEIQNAMATDAELSAAISAITIGNGTVTVNTGSGLTGSGSFTMNQTGATTVTLSHADTSTAANLTASGRTYVSGLTFDTYGHVTGYTTGTETVTNTETESFRTQTVTDTDTGYTWAATGSAIADNANDTLTWVSGSGINIDVDAALDAIRITNTAPDQTVTLTGSGATSVSGTYPNFTISSTDTNTVYTLPTATSTVKGGIELFSDTVQSVAANAVSATASRTYGVQLNSAGQAVVNVPWVDTNTETESFRTQTVTDTDTGFTWAATGSAVADSATDTLTWVSGSGINIDVDAALDAIRITNSAPNVTTNITTSHAATTVTVNSSDGTNGTINAATTSLAGVMTSTDKTKLDGIEAGATADQTKADIDALGIAASTAATLATARTIGMSGVTATATSFNGGANITIPVTAVPATLLTGVIADARISGSYTGMTNLTGSGTVDFAKFLGNAADTAAAPSFSWTGDTNTGIYQPAADQLGFATAGVSRAVFNTTGLSVSYTTAATSKTTGAVIVTGGVGVSGDVWATNFKGTASSAQYSDVAERYETDEVNEAGTIMVFGGDKEVTASTKYAQTKIAGVISTDPAYMMNSDAGSDETHPYIALQGRVPCKVVGKVRKGDIIVASEYKGVGQAWSNEDIDPRMTAYVGIAIENKDSAGVGLVEVKVGK